MTATAYGENSEPHALENLVLPFHDYFAQNIDPIGNAFFFRGQNIKC
jgi:hypothetical protein